MTTALSSQFVRALLDAQHEHRAAKVYLPGEPSPLNSVVLGFDFCEQAILLDGMHEAPCHRLVQSMHSRPFWLQLRHHESFLRVECLLDSLQYDLFTMRILRYEFTDNQRWQQRIHFDSRKGPSVKIEAKDSLSSQGHIKNLSAHGALIEVFGSDLRENFGSRKSLNLALRFNELFELPLEAELRQFKFRRTPSCHSSLRVVFPHQSRVAINQIENFIEAFQLEQLESAPRQTSISTLASATA